jgi:hypothetical protein
MAKNRKKITAEKKFKFFYIKNCNLPIPRPSYSMSKLQKKPSALKRGHPTRQNMNFYQNFSTFVGHFCPPGSGSGFRIRIHSGPIEYGSNPDPDPKPWFEAPSPPMTPYYPTPLSHCRRVYTTVYLFTQGKGEGGELTREKVRGAIVHKWGRKYQQDWPPVYKLY